MGNINFSNTVLRHARYKAINLLKIKGFAHTQNLFYEPFFGIDYYRCKKEWFSRYRFLYPNIEREKLINTIFLKLPFFALLIGQNARFWGFRRTIHIGGALTVWVIQNNEFKYEDNASDLLVPCSSYVSWVLWLFFIIFFKN